MDSVQIFPGIQDKAFQAFQVSPWAFVALISIVLLFLAIREFLCNKTITEALVSGAIAAKKAQATTEAIRKDQVASNEERARQYLSQSHLNKKMDRRLSKLEAQQAKWGCRNAPQCDLREAPHDNS